MIARLKTDELDDVAETAAVFAWTAKTADQALAGFRPACLHEGEPVFVALPRKQAG